MRLLRGLLLCSLAFVTAQSNESSTDNEATKSPWLEFGLKGLDVLGNYFQSKQGASMEEYAELSRSITADTSRLKEMASNQLETSLKTDAYLQEMDQRLKHSFDQTITKIDENARLVVTYSDSLDGKMEQVYQKLSTELLDQSKLSLDLYSDFRNQSMTMLTYLANKQKLNQEAIMTAHANLDKLLLSSFRTISDRLYDHHWRQALAIRSMEEKVLQNLTVINNQQEEIKKRIKTGLDETRALFAKNELFLQDMRVEFLGKFDETLKGIWANAVSLQAVRSDIKRLQETMIVEFRAMEELSTHEIAALWAYLHNNDINMNVIFPINDIFEKMKLYVEDQDSGSRRRFFQAYASKGIGSMRRYIVQGFKPWMEAHHRTASLGSNYTHKTFEAFRDLLILHYNMTNILYVFHEAQMSANNSEYNIMLKQANRSYAVGLAKLLRYERELRENVAVHEFRVVAHRALRSLVDQIDDDWTDEEIHDHITGAQKILSAKSWSNSTEPINDYILFTTKRCDVSVHLYNNHMQHFLEHTSSNGYRFFLYRYRRDLPEEMIYDGDYEMRNPLIKRTYSNVVYDRVLKEALVDRKGSSLEVALSNYRNTTHKAVGEICESRCKVTLTTGNCLIMADGLKKYATMINLFNRVHMFAGF